MADEGGVERPGVTSPPLDAEPWAGLDQRGRSVRGAGSNWLAYGLVAFAAAVMVFLSVAVGIRAQDSSKTDRLADTRAQVLSVAPARATALLSYDYRTIDTLAAVNRPYLTAACAAGYASALNPNVRGQAVTNSSVLRATARSAAVQQLSATRASVLVIVDEERTGTDQATAQKQQLAVSVRLLRENDQWLVDDVVAAVAASDAAPRAAAARCT